MPPEKDQLEDQPKSYEDDLMADAMAAMSEVAGKAEEPEKVEATEQAVEKPSEAEPKTVAKDGEPKPIQDKTKEGEQPAAQDKQQPASVTAPPPGWSAQSKASWDKLPQHIRDDIAKREKEVSDGFARYQGLTPFDEMARRSGTTLPEALQRYTNLEGVLRRDADSGLMQVAQNLGWTQAEAAQHFARLASRLGFQGFAGPHQNGTGTQPAANQNGADDPILDALRPLMEPVLQKVGQLESVFTQAQQRDQARLADSVERIVGEFKADPKNRYYSNVEPAIERLLSTGMVERTGDFRRDLQTAYDVACRMSQEVQDALIKERTETAEAERRAKEKEAADKALQASRSITGSSFSHAGVPAKKRDGMSYEDDLEADVRAAMQSAGGRV